MDSVVFFDKAGSGKNSTMPIHKLPDSTNRLIISVISGNLFHVGVRPIEIIAQSVLCEQAPTDKLYNHFCMAELLQKILLNIGETYSKIFEVALYTIIQRYDNGRRIL